MDGIMRWFIEWDSDMRRYTVKQGGFCADRFENP